MKIRKLTAIFLSSVLAFSAMPCNATAAETISTLYVATDESLFTYETGVDGLVITGCEDTEGEVIIPSVIDGEEVVEIGEYAFMMHSASSITVPEGVKRISDYSFYECSSLSVLNLPDSLEEIGAGAFEGCTSLSEVVFSYNIKTIGDDIFAGCSDDLTVKCYDGSPAMEYVKENGIKYESLGETVVDVLKSGQCGENGGNVTWEFDRFGTLTIKGEGNMRDYSDYYDVPWFEEGLSEEITKVVVQSGVKSIGQNAFCRCKTIEEVVLPGTLTSIGTDAFFGCSSLEKINLPDSLTSIGEQAFYECSSLSEIEIPQGVTHLESYVFAYAGLETITVPATLAKIDKYAFQGLSNLKVRGYAPSELERFCKVYGFTFEKLGDVAVAVIDSGECGAYGDDNLTWEYSSDGTLTITGEGEMNDYYGSNLPWTDYLICRVVLPHGLETIGNYAFAYLDLVEEIKIPETVKEIGSSAFYNLKLLKEISIPDGVTYIGGSAFIGCEKLARVEIPQSVGYMNTGTHDPFKRITGIVIAGYEGTMAQRYAQITGKTFESLGSPSGNMAFEIDDEDRECFYSMTIDGKLFVNTTGDIQRKTYAFEKYHPCVTELVIGDDVTTISDSGYTYEYAFSDLDIVEKITIPHKVMSIGERAFEVPDASKVTIIGYEGSAAEEYAQNNGFVFESLGIAPDVIDSGVCGDNLTWEISKSGTLTVSGNGKMEDYEYDYNGGYTTPWYDYSDIITKIVFEHGVTVIGEYAFVDLDNVTEIHIPYSVMKINTGIRGVKIFGYTGSFAEEFCHNYGNEFVSLGEVPDDALLSDADYGENHHWTLDAKGVLTISGIGEMPEESSDYYYPWYEMKDSIKEVIIKEGVTTVSSQAFYEYTSIEKVTSEGDMAIVGASAFYGCENLEELNLSVIETYGYACFRCCEALETVTIPHGAKTIENYAFANCTGLEWAVVPYSVETIENYAFDYNDYNFVIKGFKGSAAEEHAKNIYIDIKFESIGTMPLEEEIIGTMGANISWKISTDGTLTVTGSGEMVNGGWGYYSIPWYNHRDYISKVVISEGITSVCSYAFYNHTELTSVSFPASLVSIGGQAFTDCKKLEEVEIPETVLNMNEAFEQLQSTLTIKGYTNSAAHAYAEKDGFKFESLGIMEEKVLESGKCGDSLDWSFDNTCTLTISGSGSMYDFGEGRAPWSKYSGVIKTISLPDDLTHIGNYAFAYHTAVFKVEFPSSLESIGEYAFYESYNIRGYEIPASVKNIASNAFGSCSYPIIVYGNPETIGENAFGYARVFAEKGGNVQVACENTDARFFPIRDSGKCGDNVYWDVDVTTGVLNITGTGEIYDYTVSWRNTTSDNPVNTEAPFNEGYMDLLKKINIAEGITRLGDNSLYGAGVREITFPSTLESIGEYALWSCGNSETAASAGMGFEKIVIPDSVTVIEANAFEYTHVEKFYMPGNVQIGRNAFSMTDATIYSTGGGSTQEYAENYGIPFVDINAKPSVELYAVNCEKDGVEVLISGENLAMGNVFVALCGNSGKLIDIKEAEPETYIMLEGEDYACVRVFVWDENLRPLCKGDSCEAKYEEKRPGSSSGAGGDSSTGGGSSSGAVSGGAVIGGVVAEGVVGDILE